MHRRCASVVQNLAQFEPKNSTSVLAMFAAFCISEEDPNQYDNVIQTDLSACSQISCHVARSLSCSPVGDLDDHNDHEDDDDHHNDHEDDHDDNNHDDH